MLFRQIFISILLFLAATVSGQTLPYGIDEGAALLRQYKVSHNDTLRVQLLLKLSSFYLLKPGEDKKDMDTALLLARQAGTLSRQLQYASGTDNALYWEGRIHIEDTAFNAVYPLLQQVNDTTRIKLLLEMYDYQLCNPPRNPSRPGYFDSAFRNAQQAMALSQSAGLVDWQLRCRIRYANQQMQLDQYAQARAIYQHVFDSSLQRRFLQGMQQDQYWISAWSGSDTALSDLLVQCSKKLMAVYPTLRDTAFKGPVHQLIYTWIIGEGNHFIGRKQLQRAAESMERLFQFERTYPLARFDNYSSQILIYNALGQYDRTFYYIFAAMHILEASGNPDHEDGPYWNAGMLYGFSHNDSLALQYYRQAILLARQKGIVPPAWLVRYAQLLLHLKRPAEALHLLLDNTQSGERNNLYDNRDRKWIAEGLGDSYYALGQYQQAEPHYLEAARLSEGLHLVSETLNAWYIVGRFYANTLQYEKARPFLEKLAANKDIIQLPIDLKARTERYLFRIDSAAGDYIAAIRHQNRFEVLNDSLYNLTRVKQFEEVKASYETQQKDQQLLMKDKDLVHTRLLRNLFIGGAVLLVLLLALLFNRYNLKRKSNRLLQKLVGEKEWLVKEVHHRVKNNLQIVISLLNMQAHYLKDELTLQAFGDASHRIRAISLIHQKLYQEENMAMIYMPDYIRELVSFLADASQGMHVHFVMDLDPVELDASQSVPVGLILNEAITNAFKYAFPQGITGTISISFKANGNHLELCIADTGKGLSVDFNPANSKTLGFQLMNILSEQLDGRISVESNDGVVIRICFEKTTSLPV